MEELSKRPVAVIGESSDHSRIAALTCVGMVLKEIEKKKNNNNEVTKLIIWSDGCASQFRSRLTFKLIIIIIIFIYNWYNVVK